MFRLIVAKLKMASRLVKKCPAAGSRRTGENEFTNMNHKPITTVLLSALVMLLSGCVRRVAPSSSHWDHDSADQIMIVGASSMSAAATAPLLTESATLEPVLAYAFGHNPRLRAAFERWQAARQRLPQTQALADPSLSFEYFLRQMDSRYQASISQMFPAFGVRRLRSDQTAAEAEAAMHAFDGVRFELYIRVVRAFHDYYYLGRATAVMQENHALLKDLQQAVTARYEAGAVPFADLSNIQIEEQRLAQRLATLQDQRQSQSAQLAALLNLPSAPTLAWPQFVASPPLTLEVSVLESHLRQHNSQLQAATAEVSARSYAVELARRRAWPQFMLGAAVMVMPGMNGGRDDVDYSLMLGVSLPIWVSSYAAERREAAAHLRATILEREDAHNQLAAALRTAFYDYADAQRRRELFTTSLVPKAKHALDVATQEYAAGSIAFLAMIDAQRTLLEFQLLAERAAVEREIALAEIGSYVGSLAITNITAADADTDSGNRRESNHEHE